jgi:NADH:ubiquinone oxidoreductase subunit 2 (subunit N)
MGAIYQVRIKRFFAYTSIAHTGYLGLALVSGVESFLFYLFAYTLTNLAVFSLFLTLRDKSKEKKLSDFDELPPLANSFPVLTVLLALGIFSMAGIPPLVGFLSKYYIILSLISVKFYFPLSILLFFSVLSTYYYLKTIRSLFFSGFVDWNLYYVPATTPLGVGFIFSLFFCLTFLFPDIFIFPFKLFNFSLNYFIGREVVSSYEEVIAAIG